MKIYKLLLASMATLLFLSACGSSSTSQPTMTADEILEKSVAAMSELNSYSMEMDIDQVMSMPGQEEEVEMTMKMNTDMVLEPMQFYMLQEISSPELGTDETMTTESYFTEEGFYTKESLTNTWIKYDDEFAQSMIELQESQMKPEEQLNLMKKFAKNITAEEDDAHYILNLDADGEVLMEMVLEVMGLMGEDMSLFEELLGDMDISKFAYKIYIDKETFHQTKMDIETEMAITVEEETMTMKQAMTGTVNNFNNVDEITIPQEAVDTAQEFSMDGMMDFENMEGMEGIEIPAE